MRNIALLAENVLFSSMSTKYTTDPLLHPVRNVYVPGAGPAFAAWSHDRNRLGSVTSTPKTVVVIQTTQKNNANSVRLLSKFQPARRG